MTRGPARARAAHDGAASNGEAIAWTDAQRHRLSAIRTGAVPAGFVLDADEASLALGCGGPAPVQLTLEHERLRQRHLALTHGTSYRSFSDSYWNPLIALWVARAGWDFVFDLVMPRSGAPWTNDLCDLDPSMAWVAIRRYLHVATPQAWQGARARVEPLLGPSRHRGAPVDERGLARARAHAAFAFDRDEPEHIERLLADVVDPLDLCVLAAAATDARPLFAAVGRLGPLPSVRHVFDMVESMGSGALPFFDLMNPVDPRALKLLAEARSLCAATDAPCPTSEKTAQ